MKIATILSSFEGIASERFFDEYIYQIMVVRDIIKNKRMDIFPVSVDVTYEQAFNSYDREEHKMIQQKLKEIHSSSQCILVCLDRGFTTEMEEIVNNAILNNNAEILFYSIYPEKERIGTILKTVNGDSMSPTEKVNLIKTFCKTLKKNNALIYRQTGDLTNYRKYFYKSIAYAENEALITFAAGLEKKLDRDMIGGKKTIEESPFEILKNVRNQVEQRKVS